MADDTPTLVEFLLSGAKDIDGSPLANGLVYFYEAGTTKLKTVWEDEAMNTPVASPAELDAAGVGIWFGLGNYKIVICNAEGAVIQTIDGVSLGRDSTYPNTDDTVPMFLTGIPGIDGRLIPEGSAALGGSSVASWVTAPASLLVFSGNSEGSDLVIFDKDAAIIRTIPDYFMGLIFYDEGTGAPSFFTGLPKVLHAGISGFRNIDGNLCAGGKLSWAESTGLATAYPLYKDPQMTQKHPAEILLGSRGDVLAYGRGVYAFTVKDADGDTQWTFSQQLGVLQVPLG